ncbi:MAG: hypothetical protein O3B72_06785 [Proteobacteria bacterium]|nr:hypothetical protein [Pseudomonadota bacterium]
MRNKLKNLRNLMLALGLVALAVTGTPEDPASEVQLASAVDADVTNPVELRIVDNYGDPSRFVKYIIRRPPVLA